MHFNKNIILAALTVLVLLISPLPAFSVEVYTVNLMYVPSIKMPVNVHFTTTGPGMADNKRLFADTNIYIYKIHDLPLRNCTNDVIIVGCNYQY